MDNPSKDLEDKLEINTSRAASMIIDATPNSEISDTSPILRNDDIVIDHNRG